MDDLVKEAKEVIRKKCECKSPSEVARYFGLSSEELHGVLHITEGSEVPPPPIFRAIKTILDKECKTTA